MTPGDLHVVLFQPEIHWNTGNAGRSCLAAGAQLHLIEPLGFSLDEKQVRRSGLDYWEHVNPVIWPDWPSFETEMGTFGEPYFLSTRGAKMLWDVDLGSRTILVFGRETGGLPAEIHERYAGRIVRLPIVRPEVRSLNLSTTVGIALYETLRQREAAGAR